MIPTPQESFDIVDDKPQVVNADLRKFNKSKAIVNAAVSALLGWQKIETKENCEAALATLKEAKTVEKKIEEKRKELVGPFNKAVKEINDYAKKLVEKLPFEIDRVKNLVIDFQKEEERKARAAMLKARGQQLLDMGFEADGVDGPVFKYEDLSISAYMLGVEEPIWIQMLNDNKDAIESRKLARLKAKESELENLEFFGSDDDVVNTVNEIEKLAAPVMVQTSSVYMPAATSVKGITKRWTFEISDASLVPRAYLVVDEKKVREAIAAGTRDIPGIRIFQQEGLTIR